MRAACVVLLLGGLAACAPRPISYEAAERQCRQEAGLADGFGGRIGAGVSNDGPVASGSITITNRILNPTSPRDYLEQCIADRTAGRSRPTTAGITIGGST